MKTFVAGFLLGIVVLPLALYLYFSMGAAPVATSAPELPFEKRIARLARRARIRREMPTSVPIAADERNLVAGAAIYREQCTACHALAGQEPTTIAKGMFPKPPELFRGKGVTDDPPGQTYWKVANGIRLSGMPAFRGSLTEMQLWQVTLLLTKAHQLSPAVHAALEKQIPHAW